MAKLLTRDEFREAVFVRDNHTCVVCSAPAVDAHHVMERRLWSDGGYYLDNGVSLCARCHLDAEKTVLSPQALRDYAGITKVLLPDSLYSGQYDKWGNTILPNGQRMVGELFYDESVQKVLADVPDSFTTYVKYPRTPHFAWSPGASEDDIMLGDTSNFANLEIVVTEKMDGENTTMYRDYIHSRSLESGYHPSRTWVKNLHGKIANDIPEGWRICGENLYAKHSIQYDNLTSYFQVFSIWNRGTCLSWDDTEMWCELLGLETVPVLYRGHDQNMLFDIEKLLDLDKQEGYVVRPAGEFNLAQFRNVVAKYVRPDHIQADHHWIHKQVITNGVAK